LCNIKIKYVQKEAHMPYSINSPCPVCGREFNYSIVKMDNDIRHEIGCPYCNATVGWASGTDEVNTCKIVEPSKPSTSDYYF
jgi:DNA-directed RNA polymerase subunit RPC12/RpoP